jgi:PAS domain S-box-containing protein
MSSQLKEARLRAVVETAVDGVILIDDHGQILMFNPACERLFGYSSDEVQGKNVKILMPSPYHDEHDDYLQNYRQTGEQKIIGIGREVVGRRKDGGTFPMDLSVGESREEGETIFVGVIHDLSERKQVEQALRESAEQLKAVVETAVDGVILIDAHGRILVFNPACERLFGYSAKEVMGENVKVLMPPPYYHEHDSYLENYRTTGQRKIIGIGREVVGKRRDGSTFPMDLSVGETQKDGAAIFVGVIHDLSERKRAEEQLTQAQKMESVGQLSGGIAHDFNNLLTVIIGNAEALTERLKARPDLSQMADSILAAGLRGADLTSHLLAFSRRQVLTPARIDCSRLILGMERMIRRTLREDVVIQTRINPELHAAFADATQLQTAVLNLVINARDAMPNGGNLTIIAENITVDDSYHPEVTPGAYVMIVISDEGEGMSTEVRERAFEPFFTTKEVGSGSGLGLSMVYGFVKQSGGHLTIYSEPGLGTCVRIYLPAVAGEKPDAVAALKEAGEPIPRGNETILVAEDDPFVLSHARNCLENLGYRVVCASDGHEAMELLESNATIDVLFTDIVMPGGINGIDLAERAIDLRPNLKVLMTSGYAIETLQARGRLPPDSALLNKPYRKADLARRLRQVIEIEREPDPSGS